MTQLDEGARENPHGGSGLNVVLLQPEIPQNTGNIARTCACMGARLHLVHPLGFHLTQRNIRRSGMDYFQQVDVVEWPSTEAFLKAHGCERMVLFTGRVERALPSVDLTGEDSLFLVFGRESTGIDEEILQRYEDSCVRIPMLPGFRSLNLANSVAIGLYEALRQRGLPGLV